MDNGIDYEYRDGRKYAKGPVILEYEPINPDDSLKNDSQIDSLLREEENDRRYQEEIDNPPIPANENDDDSENKTENLAPPNSDGILPPFFK